MFASGSGADIKCSVDGWRMTFCRISASPLGPNVWLGVDVMVRDVLNDGATHRFTVRTRC